MASKEKRADPPAPPTADEATARRSEVVVDDEVRTEAALAASPSLPDQRPMPGPPPGGRGMGWASWAGPTAVSLEFPGQEFMSGHKYH